METENPVINKMLDELRVERPDLWPLVQQWLETPPCLHLIHFLTSSPHQSLTLADLASDLGHSEEEVQMALSCLMMQGIVIRLELPEVGVTFYRLTDQEPEREIVSYFQSWCRRWREQLEAANQLLGRGWHWDEKQKWVNDHNDCDGG